MGRFSVEQPQIYASHLRTLSDGLDPPQRFFENFDCALGFEYIAITYNGIELFPDAFRDVLVQGKG